VTKLYVPEIGDVLTLSKPWMFKLYFEGRNSDLYEQLGLVDTTSITNLYRVKPFRNEEVLSVDQPDYWDRTDAYWLLDLPKGTRLQVDRIYIRKGAKDFSSLSFLIKNDEHLPEKVEVKVPIKVGDGWDSQWVKTRWEKPPYNKPAKKRFWAKLSDVNRIEFE